jgi:hemerythrin-like domain-containing protein
VDFDTGMDTDEPFFDGREMLMIHDMLRREFGLMPGLVRGVADGDERRAKIIGDHFALLSQDLHQHHHFEDEYVWPLLVERCGPEVAPARELMEGQHADVARLGQAVDAAMTTWRAGAAGTSRDTLARALDELAAILRQHLAAEEEGVVPLMEKHIPAAEWNQILQKGIGDADPDGMTLLFGLLMYEAPAEIIDLTVAQLPAEAQPVIRQLATQAFVAHSQLVHGTTAPPRSTDL